MILQGALIINIIGLKQKQNILVLGRLKSY